MTRALGGWRHDEKKLTNIMEMSKDLQIILTDMHRNLQIILTDMPRNLQIILTDIPEIYR